MLLVLLVEELLLLLLLLQVQVAIITWLLRLARWLEGCQLRALSSHQRAVVR